MNHITYDRYTVVTPRKFKKLEYTVDGKKFKAKLAPPPNAYTPFYKVMSGKHIGNYIHLNNVKT